MITISGKTENLKTLINVLALSKGDDCLFPHRRIIIQKKPDGTHVLAARQLAPAGSVYSQVLIKPDGTEPFLMIEGEGDLTIDMKKAQSYIKELGTYQTAFIKHNDDGETVFGSVVNEQDNEEYRTREDNIEIDDAAVMLGTKCQCDTDPSCPTCKGTGVLVPPPLSFKNKISLIPPHLSCFGTPDIQFEIDSGVMRTVGDKSSIFVDDTFPLQFSKDSLVVSISNPADIKQDSFKKSIPVTYTKNTKPDYRLFLSEFYKYIFSNLTDKLTLYSADLPVDERSIYVVMNKTGGFHTGIKVMAKKEE